MPDLNFLSSTELSLHTLVMLTLYLVIGIYTIFSSILYYHWKAYGTDTKVTAYTLIIYFSTTLPLLIIMTTLALII